MSTNDAPSLLIKILRSIVLIIGGLVSIVVVFAALTLFVPTNGNPLIIIGIMTWSVLGPLFVVASLAVVIVTFVLRRKVNRWFANTTIVLSVLALLSSSGIVGNFIKATYDNGGSINVLSTIWPFSTKPAVADITETYQVADGKELKAVVAGYPVVNPGYSYDQGQKWWNGQSPKDFTADYIGGSPKEHPERVSAISSLTYASWI